MLKNLSACELYIVFGGDYCSCIGTDGTAIRGREVGSGTDGLNECRRYCCQGGLFDNVDVSLSFTYCPSFLSGTASAEGKGGDRSGITFGVNRSCKARVARFSVNGVGGNC